MKRIIILGLFLLCLAPIFAQNQSDSIEIKKTFFGTVYKQNGKNLTLQKLLNITRRNTEAYKEMEIAKPNYTFGSVFGFAGGLLVGWPIGGAIAGKEMDWALFGIGAGLIVLSIPFSIAYTKHTKNAIRIYNDGLNQTGMNAVNFKLGLTPNGLGITMTF